MWFFSLTYGLYRNVLYNFQIFGGTAQISFIIDFCYNYIEVWEHILTISTLLYLLKCFIVQNMAYPGKYSMCIWKKKSILLFFECSVLQMSVRSSWQVLLFTSFYWFLVYLFFQLLRRGLWNPQLYLWVCLFLF